MATVFLGKSLAGMLKAKAMVVEDPVGRRRVSMLAAALALTLDFFDVPMRPELCCPDPTCSCHVLMGGLRGVRGGEEGGER